MDAESLFLTCGFSSSVCILERAGILGGDTPWINGEPSSIALHISRHRLQAHVRTVFAIIFELSSAYSNNGLSLGHGEVSPKGIASLSD